MLKSTYIELLKSHQANSEAIDTLWQEITTNYSNQNRHYHNLQHIENLLMELRNVEEKIDNWKVILFSLFYHDIIYKTTKKDNEEKSAILATKRMTQIGVNNRDIQLCYQQIIATKNHRENSDSDTNYFTDADLSILGQNSSVYNTYCQNIRKEYAIYPTFLYNKGRKKVINHFLSQASIYKTTHFFEKYETQAKSNLTLELKRLV